MPSSNGMQSSTEVQSSRGMQSSTELQKDAVECCLVQKGRGMQSSTELQSSRGMQYSREVQSSRESTYTEHHCFGSHTQREAELLVAAY